jgi:hypothetical protein
MDIVYGFIVLPIYGVCTMILCLVTAGILKAFRKTNNHAIYWVMMVVALVPTYYVVNYLDKIL